MSILELIIYNDSIAFNGRFFVQGAASQNWLKAPAGAPQKTVDAFYANAATFFCTAQTSLAASYGIIQILYISAIQPFNWTGAKASGHCYSDSADCNPRYLFDTPQNIAAGLGSIALGGAVIAKGLTTRSNMSLDHLQEILELETAYRSGLYAYNKNRSYRSTVVEKMRLQVPNPASITIFQ